ncbi:hypothetical protein AVEN_44633-1 [Araneus ventricosus]|uniref:Uncharacterized protein n=1 Tax=Araneus ventricosus TaxID=182803 RepID=A0A4Y2Q731_ARAVE|nr:hypothetical protein AVEN_44633-1 [Araneus ventricosus]
MEIVGIKQGGIDFIPKFSPNSSTTASGGCSATTYDLTCNRHHTRRILSGIGFRAWNPPAPKLNPYHRGLYTSEGWMNG